MVYRQIIGCTLGSLISVSAAAECLQPATPILPNGAIATESEIIQAQQFVKDYSSEAGAYLKCLEQEEQLSLASGSETEESKSQRDSDYQSMLETIQTVDDRFLKELKKFKGVDK